MANPALLKPGRPLLRARLALALHIQRMAAKLAVRIAPEIRK